MKAGTHHIELLRLISEGLYPKGLADLGYTPAQGAEIVKDFMANGDVFATSDGLACSRRGEMKVRQRFDKEPLGVLHDFRIDRTDDWANSVTRRQTRRAIVKRASRLLEKR